LTTTPIIWHNCGDSPSDGDHHLNPFPTAGRGNGAGVGDGDRADVAGRAASEKRGERQANRLWGTGWPGKRGHRWVLGPEPAAASVGYSADRSGPAYAGPFPFSARATNRPNDDHQNSTDVLRRQPSIYLNSRVRTRRHNPLDAPDSVVNTKVSKRQHPSDSVILYRSPASDCRTLGSDSHPFFLPS